MAQCGWKLDYHIERYVRYATVLSSENQGLTVCILQGTAQLIVAGAGIYAPDWVVTPWQTCTFPIKSLVSHSSHPRPDVIFLGVTAVSCGFCLFFNKYLPSIDVRHALTVFYRVWKRLSSRSLARVGPPLVSSVKDVSASSLVVISRDDDSDPDMPLLNSSRRPSFGIICVGWVRARFWLDPWLVLLHRSTSGKRFLVSST